MGAILDFFWPTLESSDPPQKKDIILDLKKSDLDIALDFAIREYESEQERFKNTETKSIVFIGVIGFATILTFNISKEIVFSSPGKPSVTVTAFIITTIVFLIYLLRAIHFAIKALKRRGFARITFEEYLNRKEPNQKLQTQMIVSLAKSIEYNRAPINDKVTQMAMAQEYFICALRCMFLYLLIFLTKFAPTLYAILNDLLITPHEQGHWCCLVALVGVLGWALYVAYKGFKTIANPT